MLCATFLVILHRKNKIPLSKVVFMKDNLITIAIRSLEQAQLLADQLKKAGIEAFLHQVGADSDKNDVGMRVRIDEKDLVKALKIIENPENANVLEQNLPLRQILVPTDFSDYSQRACEIAFHIANMFPAVEIVLLHAYIAPNSFATISGRRAVASPDKDATRYFKSAINADIKNLKQTISNKIKAEILPNIRFSAISVEGIPEEVIVEYCAKYQPMLVVMGTRAKNKKAEDLIGSVTAEVVEHAVSPVLAIPENSDIQRIDDVKNILFATNFDERTLLSFHSLMDIFKQLKFNMLIAHFETKHNDWNEIKLAGLKDYCLQNYPEIATECIIVPSGQDILQASDKLIAEKNIDLIVMNTHKRRLFARLFNPSMARKMVFHAHTPILVFRS